MWKKILPIYIAFVCATHAAGLHSGRIEEIINQLQLHADGSFLDLCSREITEADEDRRSWLGKLKLADGTVLEVFVGKAQDAKIGPLEAASVVLGNYTTREELVSEYVYVAAGIEVFRKRGWKIRVRDSKYGLENTEMSKGLRHFHLRPEIGNVNGRRYRLRLTLYSYSR